MLCVFELNIEYRRINWYGVLWHFAGTHLLMLHAIPYTHYYITTESIDFCCFLFFHHLLLLWLHVPRSEIEQKNTTNVALQYNSPYDFLGAFSHKPFRRFIHSVFFYLLLLQKKILKLDIGIYVWEDSSWRRRREKKHWIWSTNSWAILRVLHLSILTFFVLLFVYFTFHLDISWLGMPTTVVQALIHKQKKTEKLPMWTKKSAEKEYMYVYGKWQRWREEIDRG